MSLAAGNLRALYESCIAQSSGGRVRFVHKIKNMLGLCDARGNNYRDKAGNLTYKRDAALRADQFSLAESAEAIIGRDWKMFFDGRRGGEWERIAMARALTESTHAGDSRAILESTGVGAVSPTAFLNINAFTALVGGLMQIKILEGYENPAYIAEQLMPAEQTSLNGEKVIGISSLGDKAKRRLPGDPHERTAFRERWVETPETEENALAIDVLKETIAFDKTNLILTRASQVGDALALRKEYRVIDVFAGVNNATFKYGGTVYATYSTSQVLGYLNDFSNPFYDWTSIQNVKMKFKNMRNPETNIPIMTMPNMIVCSPAKEPLFNLALGATETERRSAGSATQATAAGLNIARGNGNPFGGQYRVLSSALLDQRLTDADGLNLSQANADEYYWTLQQGRPFKYMQNHPLSVTPASPTNYEMIDKGIAATYFANERGVPAVHDPHFVVRSTN